MPSPSPAPPPPESAAPSLPSHIHPEGEESQLLASSAAVQFTFPVEPERAQSLQWEGDMVLVCTSDTLYFLSLDAEQEAAPTYLRLPSLDPQEELLSHTEQTMYAWKHVSSARITCARLSPLLPWGEGPYRRVVAMASSQGAVGLYLEVSVGEWIPQWDLLPLLLKSVASPQLETYLAQCMAWIAWEQEALLLVASKGGKLFVFWVWEKGVQLAQWVHMAPAQSWVSALTGRILMAGDPLADGQENGQDQVQLQVTAGFSHGGIARTLLQIPLRTPENDPPATQATPYIQPLVPAGGAPVERVGECPWDSNGLEWLSGCHWCRLDVQGGGRVQRAVASSSLVTDLEWSVPERQVTVVSLDGSLQVYNDAMELVSSYRYAQANWGLYGVRQSPHGLHVATVAKTPKGEEKMFTTLTSKSVLDVRLPQRILASSDASLLDMCIQEWAWPERPQTYWDKQAALFQAHRMAWYGDSLLPRLLGDMEALPWDEASTWTSPAFRRLQFLHSFVVQCQRRGIALPSGPVAQIRQLLFRRHAERSLQRIVALSSPEQALVQQSAGALRTLRRMMGYLRTLSLSPGGQGLLEKTETLLGAGGGEEQETCGLCRAPVEGQVNPVWQGRVTCQAGHALDRCTLSLAPLVRAGNLLCYGCRGHVLGSLIHSTREWRWAWEEDLRCPYCRLPFRPFIAV